MDMLTPLYFRDAASRGRSEVKRRWSVLPRFGRWSREELGRSSLGLDDCVLVHAACT